MTDLYINSNTNTLTPYGNAQRRPVEGTRDGAIFTAGMGYKLGLQGRIYCATDADANDVVVSGVTSFADTTPTFLIDVPSGTVCLPQHVQLVQAGSVAGAVIYVTLAICSTAVSYASGGTAEAVFGARTDKPNTQACSFYSLPTCTTALLTKQVWSAQMGPDISPAEGAVPEFLWTPEKNGHPLILVGPASFAVFTYAGTTSPTWLWSVAWAEMPAAAVTG